MNFSAVYSILSAVVFAFCSTWYAIDVAKKKVTVSIATFLMFTLINLSQLAALVDKHVWRVVPFTAVGLVTSLLILLFALRNKKIYFELLDKIGLAGAIIGFVVWLATKDAALNIYLLSAVNLLTFIPLIVKSFKRPDLETVIP